MHASFSGCEIATLHGISHPTIAISHESGGVVEAAVGYIWQNTVTDIHQA